MNFTVINSTSVFAHNPAPFFTDKNCHCQKSYRTSVISCQLSSKLALSAGCCCVAAFQWKLASVLHFMLFKTSYSLYQSPKDPGSSKWVSPRKRCCFSTIKDKWQNKSTEISDSCCLLNLQAPPWQPFHVWRLWGGCSDFCWTLIVSCVNIHTCSQGQSQPSFLSHKKQMHSNILWSTVVRWLSLNLQTVLVYNIFSAWIVMEVISYKVTTRQNCSDTLLC